MHPKELALFSLISVLPASFAAAQTPPQYNSGNPAYPSGTKSCGIPNDPRPTSLPYCKPCEEKYCEVSGADAASSGGGPSGMSPLGPSPHSGAGAPAGEVEAPKSVIGINHGGALLNTTDLAVPGSLCGVPLQFTRYYNSRDAESYGDLMGHGRTWTHSFSWRMTVQGTTAFVDFPSGRRLEFTQVGTTTYRGQSATLFTPPAGHGERIYRIGNFWHVDQVGAAAHTFERVVLPDSTVLYHPRESMDTRGNKLTYQTNSAARITKATDALGNTIELTYAQITLNRKAAVVLHTVNVAPVVGWNEVTIPAGSSFRWIQGVSAPSFNFEISEIEFYKNNGSGGFTKLSGTPYGTGPALSNSTRTFAKHSITTPPPASVSAVPISASPASTSVPPSRKPSPKSAITFPPLSPPNSRNTSA